MMRGRAALTRFAVTVAATATIFAPAYGQGAPDRVRLDDFALPPSDRSTGVQQLSDSPRVVVTPPVAERDVSVQTGASPGAKATGPVVQVSPAGEAIRATPRGPEQARSARGVSDLSARQDSAPRAVAALSGDDNCDPQVRRTAGAGAPDARCRRILELRSAEFDAPRAPVLSAAQRIIVEQQRRDGRAEMSTVDGAARTLARTVDADNRTSQELASVVLTARNSAPQSPPPAALDNPKVDTGLSEVLQALVVQLGGQPRP